MLLTRVLLVKQNGGKTFVVVDGAMNDLLRPALYQAHHEISPLTEAPGGLTMTADVVGPVCETGDFFARDRRLPDLQAGDLIALRTAGAYGFVLSSNYNSRPRPCELLIDGSRVIVPQTRNIRRLNSRRIATIGRMADSACISVENLHKSYGDFEAVRGIDLEVKNGEVYGLLGPNGAGKTTTFEILEGLRPRTSGSVSVLGLDPASQSKTIKDRIGVCLQATNLPDKMKVHEALDLFGGFLFEACRSRSSCSNACSFGTRKTRITNRFPAARSSEWRWRCRWSTIRSLLFLDEPTTGLDPQVRHEIHSVIQELKTG